MRGHTAAPLSTELRHAIRTRTKYRGGQLHGSGSGGGTYILSATGLTTDNGKMRDLAAITIDGRVVALSPTTNPDWLDLIREAIEP